MPEAVRKSVPEGTTGICLILGASSDIGNAVIRAIDSNRLCIVAQYNEGLEKLERLRGDLRSSVLDPVRADLSRTDDVEALIAHVRSRYGHPTHVVHLAAPRPAPLSFRRTAWEDFQMQWDVQVRAATIVLKAFLPTMARDGIGKVVFVLTSYTVAKPPAGVSPYITAKYALLGLAKSLAAEYAPKGICINAVSPSMVETAFLENLPPMVVQTSADESPLKRNASPDDVAGVVAFLLSAAADYVTGTNIPVTGGSVF
ncbi:MAG: SDR family oxidoreductase [bacterium]|nr:SDR family oxidoreductase [bacterium]